VELASAVADQLAIAIQQSRLYQRVQQLNVRLEQKVQQRTAQLRQALTFEALLKSITDKVRDSLDEDHILQAAVDELGQGLQVICCKAALYNLTLAEHTITHEYSTTQRFALGQQTAFADCPTSEIFDQLIQHICLQFCFTVSTYAQPDGEIYTILACPIRDDQGVLGDLWLYRPKHKTFDELEVRLVQQVANQCAIALRQSRLYQAAQLQVQELERLNGLKDDFLNTVSHELRTPMANIKMATQMLEISIGHPQPVASDSNGDRATINKGNRAERYLQILKEECQRETSLINDLLDLSRLDSGLEPLMPLTHRLQYWLPHITESFVERTHSQQQQLSITIDDELPPLTTDFNYLEMILTELLHNACKYTPPGDAIAVSTRFEPVTLNVILAIANSGVEIPAHELKYVFDKFYRVPNNDPWKHGGTGLGLALVKKRVERLSGAIAVASQDGWTTFTIQLPLQSQ
jgi:signal transduction histidine kinase